jgi:hypothetical protein
VTDNADSKNPRSRWLLLIHQLPAQPAYLRVKVGRRLQGIGAIALKNSVYVLPVSETAHEDFQWVRREIVEGSGDATIAEARMVEGLTDAEIESRFRENKDVEYAEVTKEARELRAAFQKLRRPAEDERASLLLNVVRLEQRIEALSGTDFYGASGREVANGAVSELRSKASTPLAAAAETPGPNAVVLRGRTWVTRTGIQVDRIASAWLIRRFIDAEAHFKFVPSKGYAPADGELRFDMFEAEYSHEGDRCTFETLCRRFSLGAPGLAQIAEVIHDIDLKDSKFERPETAGIAACLSGISRISTDDDDRLRRGTELLEALLQHYSTKKESRR